MFNRTVLALLAGGSLLAMPAAAAQRWGNGPAPEAGACFYQQPNYRGQHFCARVDQDVPVLRNGFNNRIRSIRVYGGGQVILYSDGRFGGSERWIDYNVPDLRAEGWDGRISSIGLSWRGYGNRYDRNAGGRPLGTSGYYQGQRPDSPRYGANGSSRYNTAVTIDQARAMVRSAYLNLLGREPDPASASWVDHVLKDHLSQQQLESELRNSAEYRQKHPRG
jgi:Peptidase inhibitor family I36